MARQIKQGKGILDENAMKKQTRTDFLDQDSFANSSHGWIARHFTCKFTNHQFNHQRQRVRNEPETWLTNEKDKKESKGQTNQWLKSCASPTESSHPCEQRQQPVMLTRGDKRKCSKYMNMKGVGI
jgi:hypothetical protein